MPFESFLDNLSREHNEYAKRRLEVARSGASQARDAAHFFGLEKSAGVLNEADKTWKENFLDRFTAIIALGRELDRTNFYRDPHVNLAVELAIEQIRTDPVEHNAFVAELLEIALDNATEIAASDVDNKGAMPLTDARRALADDSWSRDEKQLAANTSALIKKFKEAPVRNQNEQASVGMGKSLAREVWKTVEPRASFWDRPQSSSAQKFAGKSPAEIRSGANELAAKIDRECSEKLAKINAGSPVSVGQLHKAVRAAGEKLATFNGGQVSRGATGPLAEYLRKHG
jgi:hypothetical protein